MTGSGAREGGCADTRARVALSRLAEPGDTALGAAVADLGAEEVLARIRESRLDSSLQGHYRARLAAGDVELDLRVARTNGVRVVVPADEEWPGQLADLGPAQPLLLWAAGSPDLAATTGRSVAVVGARACTAYGDQVAAELGAGLAERGWTVVSGAAFGVDAAAHRGAMAAGGLTVAVLACGPDLAYPQAHERLLAHVRSRGAVLTELPPGSRPSRTRFLQRNRVIAALARGTVVVEAAARSGAKNTASHCDDLSRPVMAVPGPVTSPMSAGCHQLIRTAGATLVTNAAEVVDLVGDWGLDAAVEARGQVRPEDALDTITLRVVEALPGRRWALPDEVAAAAGIAAPMVLRALAHLGDAGLAETRSGAWRRARPAPPAAQLPG